MPKITYIVSGLLLLFIVIISFTTYQSEDSIIQQVEKVAEDTFFTDEIPVENYNGEHFQFYLPAQMDVTEVDDFNAVLTKGEQTVIVFYNKLENDTSKLNYEAAKTDDAALLTTFSDERKFGYIRLLQEQEDTDYEIQIGVGGVKLTTFSSKHNVVADTENLMMLALSIVD
ncbi:hypothetical protein [Ornithinibacillus halotolerans]|uniref:Uncharacterized protein n=1 Tax=Ornithinibacillus halotolerans TaxID=1274357 RepID=A0A916WAF4_9BACI|nr:hypothetical protein [Ornithinibacillus halotolerans]GGA82472.1 hypothetical protein GCM10008025_27120 [Ornithinibacillus halotolerans]